MSDRDLKCVHCYEDQSNYGNLVDAVFIFDGLSLCADHYHGHRDLVISNALESPPVHMHHESYLGPESNNSSTVTIISVTADTPEKHTTIPYRDEYVPPNG